MLDCTTPHACHTVKSLAAKLEDTAHTLSARHKKTHKKNRHTIFPQGAACSQGFL